MARKTAAQKAATEAVRQAQADAALQLTPQDAHNALVLLDRVQTTGHQEATLLAILAQKLKAIKGEYSGEDATPAS